MEGSHIGVEPFIQKFMSTRSTWLRDLTASPHLKGPWPGLLQSEMSLTARWQEFPLGLRKDVPATNDFVQTPHFFKHEWRTKKHRHLGIQCTERDTPDQQTEEPTQ